MMLAYARGVCRKPTKAKAESALAMLAICERCQAERHAAGTKRKLAAEAQEAGHGR